MLLNEPFARCEKCNDAWFERKEQYLVSRPSTNYQIGLTEHRTQFTCVSCGHVQYEIKNDIKE